MKLTATSTSTSLLDLIKTYDAANSTDVLKSVLSRSTSMNGLAVEIMRDSTDLYVETVLDTASSSSRPVNSTNPILSFNASNLANIFIYGSGTFFFSIF